MTNTFIQAFLILIREGLEAMLVIAALGAYLVKSGGNDRLKALFGGAAAAVGASIVAAWLFAMLNSGAHNDVMEAIVILAAAGLLLYVSGWLLVRQDARAWHGYLARKADSAMTKNTGYAIAMLGFLAVFREGAETVLFIQALATTSGGWSAGLIGGVVAAGLVLAAAFKFINELARRLPLRPVFIATSAFLFVMAIKFIGEAIQEFQEQSMLATTDVPGGAWLASIGFNPSLEALVAQGLVIAAAVATYLVVRRRALRELPDDSAGARVPAE